MPDLHITEADFDSLVSEEDLPEAVDVKALAAVDAAAIDVCQAIPPVIGVLQAIQGAARNPWVKVGVGIAIRALRLYQRRRC